MMQHDHHCLVAFGGGLYRIIGTRPGVLMLAPIMLPGPIICMGCGRALPSGILTIDVSHVDWSGYCAAALFGDYLVAQADFQPNPLQQQLH